MKCGRRDLSCIEYECSVLRPTSGYDELVMESRSLLALHLLCAANHNNVSSIVSSMQFGIILIEL